ncbi:hypothetical protein CTAYLR_003718 [Chrysophaeum taylorii]|uniref:Major facilitator superfamily (MFS) profile domain-containing protein n=1 Tax=Chrysophaeum taylorii TaxID=2483200 RepID=A0AAD7UNP8_9STRA|nr:hypothetical protein CTAYLR_003718 [Chrysophaeum taylorii]
MRDDEDDDDEGRALEVPLIPESTTTTKDSAGKIRLRWYHWAVVAAVDVIGPFSTDSYLPNLPRVKKDLSATSIEAGLGLQANWVAKGLATVVVGAMADSAKFGRRGAILWSLALFVVGTAACSTVPASPVGAKLFVVARVVQGMGESGTVVCSAIARDVLTDVSERVRVLAILGTLRPLAMVVSPTIGGLLGASFGWRTLFVALGVWGGLLLVVVAASIPETRPRETISAHFDGFSVVVRRLKGGVRGYFTEDEGSATPDEASVAVAALFVIAFGFAGILAYLSVFSVLSEGRFGLSVVATALLLGTVPAVIVISNGLVARRFSDDRERTSDATAKAVGVVAFGLRGLVLSAGLSLFFALGPHLLRTSILPVMAAVYVYAVFFAGAALGPTNALVVQPFPDCAGAASAFQLVARTLVSTAAAQAATDLVDLLSVRGFYFVLAFTALACQLAWPFLLGRCRLFS